MKNSIVLLVLMIMTGCNSENAYYSYGSGGNGLLYKDVSFTETYDLELKSNDVIEVDEEKIYKKSPDRHHIIKVSYMGMPGYIRSVDAVNIKQQVRIKHIKNKIRPEHLDILPCSETGWFGPVAPFTDCKINYDITRYKSRDVIVLYELADEGVKILDAVMIPENYKFMHATYHKNNGYENCYYISTEEIRHERIFSVHGFILFDVKNRRIVQGEKQDAVYLNPT